MAERTATTAGKNIDKPFQSKGTLRLRCRLRGIRSRPATTPRTPKGTLIMKMRRQPPTASSSPPTDGPRASPTAWAAPWIPMALPERHPRHRDHNDGDAVGLKHGGPNGLQDSERNEDTECRGDAAERGADHEDGKPVDVEELATPHVGEAADCRHGGYQHQEVAQTDPGDSSDTGVKGPLQRGQRHRDDAGIELAHECPDANRPDRKPVGVLPVADGRRPTRLDEETVPTRRFHMCEGLHGLIVCRL